MTYVLCMRIHCISIWNLAKSYDFSLTYWRQVIHTWIHNIEGLIIVLCAKCVWQETAVKMHMFLTRRDTPKYTLYMSMHLSKFRIRNWVYIHLQLVWELEREIHIISGQSLLVYLYIKTFFSWYCVRFLVVITRALSSLKIVTDFVVRVNMLHTI